MNVPSLIDKDGVRQVSYRSISEGFTAYYSDLYSSRVDYSMEDLHIYLSDVDFPVLTDTYRDQLDSPITLEEVQRAISSLQAGKTPGPDGFPAEFYRTCAEDLAPKFHSMLLSSLREGALPTSMSEAVIVVISKPGKEPELCKSYRPISLIDVDAKLLVTRLNGVITALVQPDQSGFMPGRGTDINIRRLFTHVDLAGEGDMGLVAALDAEKVFDSVEWLFLWEVLKCFGFGPRFISWIQLLYRNLTACVRVNGLLSPPFSLHRGTRQGALCVRGSLPWRLSPWRS